MTKVIFDSALRSWTGGRCLRLQGVALLLLAVIGAIASLVVGRSLAEDHRREGKAELALRTQAAAFELEHVLDMYSRLLAGAAALVQHDPQAGRLQWTRYVATAGFDRGTRLVTTIGLVRRIDAAAVPALEAAVRSEGLPRFRVYPPSDSPERFVLTYLEPPREGVERALGFDLWSEPARRAAMERARDSGEFALTGLVKLARDVGSGRDPEPATVMLQPVYRGVPADDPAARRQALSGFVVASVRFRDLLDTIPHQLRESIAYRLLDGEGADAIELHATHPAEAYQDTLYSARVRWESGGRTWVLAANSLPAFDETHSTTQSDWLAWTGLLSAALLAALGCAMLSLDWASTQLARRMTARLRASELRLTNLVEHVHDALIAIDRFQRIALINGAAERLFGLERARWLGQPLDPLLPDTALPAYRALQTRFSRGEGMGDFAASALAQARTADGVVFPVEVSASVSGEDEDRLLLLLVRDATAAVQEREAQAAFAQALEARVHERTMALEIERDRAEAANRAKAQFFANMSHELRTPLHGILGYAEIGLDAVRVRAPDLAKQYERIQSNAQRLLSMVEKLIRLSGLESGKYRLVLGAHDLAQCARMAIETRRAAFGERHIVLTTQGLDGPHSCWCDPTMVQEAIEHLLDNAVRAVADGGAITVSISRVDDAAPALLELAVSDNGPGFAEGEAERVFDRPSANVARLTGPGGRTGMSLTLCREVIRRHGGSIEARNRPQGGARVRFTLPMNLPKENDDAGRLPRVAADRSLAAG